MGFELEGGLMEVLRGLGMGRVEAQAYTVLVFRGAMTAKELSEELGIPYSKIYTVLRRAREMGLIDKTSERPARYYAKHPDVVWSIIREEYWRRLRRIEEEVLPVLREAYEAKPKPSSPISRVGILQGVNQVREKTINVLVESPGEVLIAIPFKDFLSEDILLALKSHARMKKPRILVTSEVYPLMSHLEGEGAEIRLKEDMFGGGIVASQVVLLLKYGGTYVGIWSDYDFFTHVARVYFEHLWSTAKHTIGITKG